MHWSNTFIVTPIYGMFVKICALFCCYQFKMGAFQRTSTSPHCPPLPLLFTDVVNLVIYLAKKYQITNHMFQLQEELFRQGITSNGDRILRDKDSIPAHKHMVGVMLFIVEIAT